MAFPTYTVSFVNNTDTVDATNVMQNFRDINNGVTDGTKDINVNTCTVGTLNVSTAFTATNKVANASLSQMAANTIKANNTGGAANAADITVASMAAMFTVPAITVLTGGSGTYNTPSNTIWLDVQGVAGGTQGNGGAGGSNGASGTTTNFGTTLLAYPGAGGSSNGGTATGGDYNFTGGSGGGGGGGNSAGGTGNYGGAGGNSPFGGGGTGGSNAPGAGGKGATNTGGGGGAGGGTATVQAANGGGAGGYFRKIITSPAVSYTYTVGVGGSSGGTAAAGGGTGASGADGCIIIIAHFV